MKEWLWQHWEYVFISFLLLLLYVVVWRTLAHVHHLWQLLTVPFKEGRSYRCKVIKVTDGDTVTCRKRFWRRQQAVMRLAYIDAPELKQEYGSQAKQALQSLLLNKRVKVLITDMDQYGRCVGDIYRSGKSISEQLIKSGHAWAYLNYAKNKQHKAHLLDLQAKAKAKKVGLWKSRKAQNPSDYRKGN